MVDTQTGFIYMDLKPNVSASLIRGHLTYFHIFKHSLIFSSHFIFVSVSGGLEPLPACKELRAETHSLGEYAAEA